MAKEVKNQTSAKPEETPVNENVQAETQNPVETEAKEEKQDEVQNPAETEIKQDEVENKQPDETPVSKVIVVLKRFRDKTDHKTLFVAGQELEFDEERANDVVSRGLAKFKDDNEATA